MDDMLSLTLNGNDALTMIHELQNLTGINPQSIPFNDARALSVFALLMPLALHRQNWQMLL